MPNPVNPPETLNFYENESVNFPIFQEFDASISLFSRNLNNHQFPYFCGNSSQFPYFPGIFEFPYFPGIWFKLMLIFHSISLFSRNLYMINFPIFQEFHFGSIHGNSWNKIYLISYKNIVDFLSDISYYMYVGRYKFHMLGWIVTY